MVVAARHALCHTLHQVWEPHWTGQVQHVGPVNARGVVDCTPAAVRDLLQAEEG